MSGSAPNSSESSEAPSPDRGGSDPWDPATYHRFAEQRRAPFDDLVGLIEPVPGGRMLDLGCGSGELTASAHESLGSADTLGIDSSAAMLERAADAVRPGLRFEAGDIGAFLQPDAWDIVLANASLQWVPDHPEVIARWVQCLRPGGQLAVQVPANPDHPSHTTITEVLAEEPFVGFADDVAPDHLANVLDPARYAEILFDLGAVEQVVRLQVYGMALPDAADVVAWTSGTALTRVKRALDPELYDQFVDRYRDLLVARLDHAAPYFYAFKRILMRARF